MNSHPRPFLSFQSILILGHACFPFLTATVAESKGLLLSGALLRHVGLLSSRKKTVGSLNVAAGQIL